MPTVFTGSLACTRTGPNGDTPEPRTRTNGEERLKIFRVKGGSRGVSPDQVGSVSPEKGWGEYSLTSFVLKRQIIHFSPWGAK